MIPLEVQGRTVPHLKGLRYSIYETRGLICGSTSSIGQDILKNGNLLHKWDFVDSQSVTTVGVLCNKVSLSQYVSLLYFFSRIEAQ